MGSSAFLLPQEPRGVYREMLTQAWRRGARLPNDHEAIRRATGTTLAEWERCWPLVKDYWREVGDYLVPVDGQLGFAKPVPGQTGRPHIPVATRRLVYERDGYACRFCGCQERISLDHIVAFSRGGSDDADNLRVLCMPCNIDRGTG
jgi:hypothetical protein